MTFDPSLDPSIWAIAPGFRALSIVVQRQAELADATVASLALENAVADVKANFPVWADAHLAAWSDVFRRFGAKPQRTPCSAQSLRDRVLKTGTVGTGDPIVDLYNAVSLKFAVPVGGENLAAYVGNPRLVIATGDETFDTMKNGEKFTEYPEHGEVVWRDNVGVTCRKWNWRQGLRTRIDSRTNDMWFILESLPQMPIEELHVAGDALTSGLLHMFGAVTVQTRLLEQG